jgi:hypothetical protein
VAQDAEEEAAAMGEVLAVPSMRAGSKVEQYIIALHQSIWDLVQIIEPEAGHTGDCLVVADDVITRKKPVLLIEE